MRRTEDTKQESRLPAPKVKRLAMACRSFNYAGADVDAGQLFEMKASLADANRKLLAVGYAQPVPADIETTKCPKCHERFASALGTLSVHTSRCGRAPEPAPAPRPPIKCPADGQRLGGAESPMFKCDAKFRNDGEAMVHFREKHYLSLGAMLSRWQIENAQRG